MRGRVKAKRPRWTIPIHRQWREGRRAWRGMDRKGWACEVLLPRCRMGFERRTW